MTGIVGTSGPENPMKMAFRDQMPVTKKYAYFDHAAVGPIPISAAQAIQKWSEQALNHGDVFWPQWSAAASKLRSLAAQLLFCDTGEIALIPNTTFGINMVSQGYLWSSAPDANENVVVLENEFSSNLLPWLALERRGVEVRKVAVPDSGVVSLDAIGDAIDSRTRLVAVSWVGYFSGFRLDLAKLCDMVHQKGAQLFVDAIQGLGVFTLNTQNIPIDYLAADGHKWMLGPEGAGILYVRQNNLNRLEPLMQGWGSLKSAHQFQTAEMILKNDASRYEGGSANHVGLIGLSESLQVLLDHGCNRDDNPVAMAVLENAAVIEQELKAAGAVVYRSRSNKSANDGLSGILTFTVPNMAPMEVRRALLHEEIVLSVRHERLRVATHAYNSQTDIDRLIEAVRACVSKTRTNFV